MSAIVAAGGRGDRAGTPSPKQFTSLGDRPLVSWSIEALSRAGCSHIVLVIPADFVAEAPTLGLPEDVEIVQGGATRQASVAQGLKAVRSESILVHDAARPFLDANLIETLLQAFADIDGVVPVLPVKETVKEVEGEDVVRTVDRSNLFLSQTPQLFRTEMLRTAHEKARNAGFNATDDAQLVEWIGGKIKTVPGSRRNIKLTYPEDFELAAKMVTA